MPTGHAPFAVMNRTANRLVKGLLRSPLHPVMSRRLALVTYTGRRSGREFSIPTLYSRSGDQVTIPVEWPARKSWWRNFESGGPIAIRLGGVEHKGTARAIGDAEHGVKVEISLSA